ncbi:interleukin-8 isoform X1 [Xenopus laevis]|uniref:C-X-C motif chemokine n=1 Tax=Xenopus laevis TaxID=8355 RepID=A0A8J1MYI1_XENLA|nr:interleukin-8 isoform X1 [Xenopus laevis]
MQSQRNSLYMIGLFLLLSHCFPESYGGSAMRELRCQCITTVSTPFHKKHIRSLEVFQKGPHCPRVEVIVTLRNGFQHCLNPDAKWLTAVVKKILKRSSQKK